jgi:hypothetical protein
MPARLASWVLGIAFAVIVATFSVSLIRLDNSSDVANVMVAVVAAISTVVVAFFGIHVAEAGRRDAEDARTRSEQLHLFEQGRVRRLATATDAEQRAASERGSPWEPFPTLSRRSRNEILACLDTQIRHGFTQKCDRRLVADAREASGFAWRVVRWAISRHPRRRRDRRLPKDSRAREMSGFVRLDHREVGDGLKRASDDRVGLGLRPGLLHASFAGHLHQFAVRTR